MPNAAQMPQISRGALAKLMAHSWPGNVRELKNTLTRALTFCEENILYAENIQLGSITLSNGGKAADAQEKQAAAQMADPQMQDGRDCLQGRIDHGAGGDGNGAATRDDPQSFNGTTAMAPGDATENQTSGQTLSSMPGSAAPISGFTASAGPPRQTPQYAPGFERAPGQESAFASASGMSANTADAAVGMTSTAMARLNSRQTEMWPRLVAMGSISRQEYQQMLGKDISMRTAQYDLQLFVQMGLVRKEGRGPAQRYVVVGASLSEG